MGALKLTACMKVVAKMGEMDQGSLLERLDRYVDNGVPRDRAQTMAASDTLAELQDERREFMRLLREQHPQLFVVSNAIPEDQDVDPDAPDIKRSAGRSEDEIASARADGWTISDNDLPSREAAERIVKLRTKGNSVVKPMAAWQDAEVRVVESDNPGLWSIEVRNPDIKRSAAREFPRITDFNGMKLRRSSADIRVSAASAFADEPFTIQPGVREIPLSEVELQDTPTLRSEPEQKRIRDLAEAIKKNRSIEPLFVAQRADGSRYVAEGQHRAYALKQLGYDSIPARVMVESGTDIKRSAARAVENLVSRAASGAAAEMDVRASVKDAIDQVGAMTDAQAIELDRLESEISRMSRMLSGMPDTPRRKAIAVILDKVDSEIEQAIETGTMLELAGKDGANARSLREELAMASEEIKRSPARNAMGFYSALAKGIEDMQTKQAPAGAWKAQIKGLVNKGVVKQDEVTWSGIDDWLDLQQGKVSKEVIADYLKQGGVQVSEVTLPRKGDDIEDWRKRQAWLENNGPFNTPEEQAELEELRNRSYREGRRGPNTYDQPPKYAQYTLPGGKNYREVLLKLPRRADRTMVYQVLGAYPRDGFKSREEAQAYIDDMNKKVASALANPELSEVGEVMQAEIKKYPFGINEYESKESRSKDYRSSHWDQPNVLAHIRVNDRTDADGKRVLFVEEIQSDWGQEGKKKGFKVEGGVLTAEESARMTELSLKDPSEMTDAENKELMHLMAKTPLSASEQIANKDRVPTAPFVTKTEGWLNLALKRVIAMAVDGGYDAVAFVNGDQSADRYDLSKQVESVSAYKVEGGYKISAKTNDGDTLPVQSAKDEDEIASMLGKELAAKIVRDLNADGMGDRAMNVYSGLDLKVGGEGMKTFYDKIVPNAVKALLKKVGGGQLEVVSIPDPEGTGRTMEVSRSPMFGGGRETIAIADEPPLQQPGFTITDAMREKVSTEGLPLFSRKRDVTDTPEFKAWFGDSKVVDEQGKPLVVYHGTAANFDRFGGASWFSEDPKQASVYAKTSGLAPGQAPNVVPAYLSMKSPLYLEGDMNEATSDDDAIPLWETVNDPNYIEDRISEGFDGIIVDEGGIRTYLAFRPEQVKSAIGNNGQFDPNDADITRSPGRTATGAAWDSPSASKWDDAVYKLQDKQVDLKRVTDAIQEAGGAIADDLNVYLQEELYHGRAAKRTEDFVNMELNPLVEQLARDGLQLEDLEEFLHARHAKEANEVIAQRNPGVQDLQDGGSGMKTGDAQQYLASLPADLRQKLENAAAKVDAILKKTRELYVDYELESRETVDAWGRMFQHYIPLMREDKDGNGSPGLGQGFSVKGRETKGRTGSTRKVVDIMANIAMQRERAIVRGEKNRVSQALVGLATANPNEGFWQVDEVPTERVFNEKTGLVEDRVDPLYKSRPNAVIAKIKGANGQVKEHAVLFNEEDPRALRMAEALKNLDANQIEGLLGVSAQITRYFAAVNTQYNPVFGVVNLVRDVQGALLNLTSTPLAGDQTKIAKYTMSALRGIYGDARAARKGSNPSSQWASLWDEFQEVGGQTGYRELFKTSADRAEAIKKALNPDAWADSKLGKIFTANGALKVPMAQAKRTAGWLFDWLSDYNLAMENGVRLAAYKAGLERGMSKEQAASAAKNLTVNFNRKGQVSQQAGAMYAFFNASLQGTARIAQTLFDMEPGKPKTIRLSPTGKKIVYGGVLLGVTQALALAAAGFNDDDPPEFARERSLIIPVGGKKYVTIPMPLGFHVLPSIGRVATEFALSGFKNPHERALQMASLFADTFNPIGNAGLSMQTLAPTALDPLVALTENKDWTGKPIARESSNKAIPGHALGRDTATSLAKMLSEGINTLSGGNKYTAGVFSPTPDQIDYLLGQVTGGVGRELSKVEQTVLSTTRGEDLPTYKIPLVGRFVGDAKSQASEGTAFYANTERLNKLETEIKGLQKDGKTAEAAELRRNSSEAYLITMANQAERQIQKLRTEKRELVKANAPREQVKAVEDRITAVMARLNRAAESLREKQNS